MQRAGDDEHREAYSVHTFPCAIFMAALLIPALLSYTSLSLYCSAVVLHIDLRDFFLAVDIVLVHSPRVAAA